jgi:hypothetical protein
MLENIREEERATGNRDRRRGKAALGATRGAQVSDLARWEVERMLDNG